MTLKIKIRNIILSLLMFIPLNVFAQGNYGLDSSAEAAGLKIGGLNTWQDITAILINSILMFLGTITLVIILYGGFTWMTARGNDEQVSKAKKILSTGVIGLSIILLSLAITNAIFHLIGVQVINFN